MRYYGYDAMLDTLETSLHVDRETLVSKLVDPVDAINSLRAAGGPPVSGTLSEDVADGCWRLGAHMMELSPFRGGMDDKAAHAVMVAYAATRGFKLALGRGRIQFINEAFVNNLSRRDALRALNNGLTQIVPPTTSSFNLQGVRVTIARPVTNPTRSLLRATDKVVTGVTKFIERHGGIVTGPVPMHRKSVDGRCGYVTHIPAQRLSSAATGKILTTSIKRVMDAHVLVIVMDPRSQGSCVEREWALRCTIPVIEFDFDDKIYPHSDACDGVTNILAEPSNPGPALDVFRQQLQDRLWEIQDSVALHDAHALKNESALSQLRLAWGEKALDTRAAYARSLGMTVAYIEGLLSGPVALELASDKQRHGLERFLKVPNTRALAIPSALSSAERRLLGQAVARMGVTDIVDALDLVHRAGMQWRASSASARLRFGEEADASVRRAAANRATENYTDDWQ